MINKLPEQEMSLPSELLARYKGEEQVARMPFFINDAVDSFKAYNFLRKQHIHAGRDVFMGIAGLRSLDLLVNIGREAGQTYTKAIMFDSNITQIKAMHNLFVLVRESETPEQFIEKFVPHYVKWVSRQPRINNQSENPAIKPNFSAQDESYFAVHGASYPPRNTDAARKYFQEQMKKPDSWLHPDNFPMIKAMIERGQIATMVTELTDTGRFNILSKHLESNGLRIGDMYLSSVLSFSGPRDHFDYWGRLNSRASRRAFHDNLQLVLDDESRLLNSCSTGQFITGSTPHAGFELNVEDRDCAAVHVLLAKDLPRSARCYHLAFNAGHASGMMKNTTSEEMGQAMAGSAASHLLKFGNGWPHGDIFLTCELNCPDYIEQGKIKDYLGSVLKLAHNAVEENGGFPLAVGKNGRNWKIIFSVPESCLNDEYFVSHITNEIRESILSHHPVGLQPK